MGEFRLVFYHLADKITFEVIDEKLEKDVRAYADKKLDKMLEIFDRHERNEIEDGITAETIGAPVKRHDLMILL